MITTRTRLAGIILALAAAVGLAGCSAIKLGYNTLPDLAWYWLDGYADFTDAQEPQVRDAIARLHAWHRHEELPRLADIAGNLAELAPGNPGALQLCSVAAELQQRLRAVIDQAEPALVPLLTGFTPEQLRHLERKYRSNNAKYRADWIDLAPAALHEKRYELLLDRAEMIYGRLEEPQRAVLREGVAQSAFDPRKILAERERRQQDVLQTLRAIADPALPATEVRQRVRGYFERFERSPDAGYRRLQQVLLDESCRLFAAVHASATTAQREQAARRLRGYQRDLRELAQRR